MLVCTRMILRKLSPQMICQNTYAAQLLIAAASLVEKTILDANILVKKTSPNTTRAIAPKVIWCMQYPM